MSDENQAVSLSSDVHKDLADTKDKLKIVTQKFANVRKERD